MFAIITKHEELHNQAFFSWWILLLKSDWDGNKVLDCQGQLIISMVQPGMMLYGRADELTTHLDDRVEAGDGWLPSEAPLLGELWSLSPLLPQVCSGASSLNSCPDIIRSISSSVIYNTYKELCVSVFFKSGSASSCDQKHCVSVHLISTD